jgi:hypothetical protein
MLISTKGVNFSYGFGGYKGELRVLADVEDSGWGGGGGWWGGGGGGGEGN